MDAIVFARETLKRALDSALAELATAETEYDPSTDLPTTELLTALSISGLQRPVSEYVRAVSDRIKLRAGEAF